MLEKKIVLPSYFFKIVEALSNYMRVHEYWIVPVKTIIPEFVGYLLKLMMAICTDRLAHTCG